MSSQTEQVLRAERWRAFLAPALFIAPGFLLFLVCVLYPMAEAARMSFFDWKVVAGSVSTFIGLGNYGRALADPHFWLSLSNSAVYMLFTVPPQIVLGLGIALLLKDRSPAQPVFRVLYYLPVVTSWVVVSLLFKYLFADRGLINYTLNGVLHVTGGNISWLSDRWTAMVAICTLGVWKGVGWSMMIFLAALQGVPQSLLEAATIDGANGRQRFRSVILPAIWPTVGFVTIMLVIGGLNVFASVLTITNGGPGGTTDVLLTYMYRQAFEYLDFGYGSAIAVLLTLLVLILSTIQLRLFRNEAGTS